MKKKTNKKKNERKKKPRATKKVVSLLAVFFFFFFRLLFLENCWRTRHLLFMIMIKHQLLNVIHTNRIVVVVVSLLFLLIKTDYACFSHRSTKVNWNIKRISDVLIKYTHSRNTHITHT